MVGVAPRDGAEALAVYLRPCARSGRPPDAAACGEVVLLAVSGEKLAIDLRKLRRGLSTRVGTVDERFNRLQPPGPTVKGAGHPRRARLDWVLAAVYGIKVGRHLIPPLEGDSVTG